MVAISMSGSGEGLGWVTGRGYSTCAMGYIPTRTLAANQLYLMSTIMAHNLFRTLQMEANLPTRGTTEKRSPLWIFQEANTLRQRLICRAGRLTRPKGKLRLTLSSNEATKSTFLHYLEAFRPCA